MICHHYKCIFVHIPKNAGQSIERVFLNLLGLTWGTRAPLLLRYNDKPELGPPRLAHLKAHEYVIYKYITNEMFNEYFKFATVRNPFCRTVSIYKYFYFKYNILADFKTFLLGYFKNELVKNKFWFVGPQSDFVFTNDGEQLVDYIIYFEDLQNGFDHVCKQIDLSQTQLKHTNKSMNIRRTFSFKPKELAYRIYRSIKQKNISNFHKYQDYYDLETLDYVINLYRKDFELFKYEY